LLGKTTVLIVPLAGIATLEALYQQSQRNHGLADVSVDRYARYTWVYLPALIVYGINLGFESVYFLSTVIQPYHMLRRKAAYAEDALTDYPFGQILVHNVWSALFKRRWALLSAAITVLLGTILPVTVAGLYTVDDKTQSYSLPLSMRTQFNASKGFYSPPWDDVRTASLNYLNAPDRNADPMASYILYNNLSFPSGSYEEFAYAEFVFPGLDIPHANITYASVTVQVPAVRGRANCTVVPQHDIRVVTKGEKSSIPIIQVNTTKADGCYEVAGFYPRYRVPDPRGETSVTTPGEYHFGRFSGAVELLSNTQNYTFYNTSLGYPAGKASNHGNYDIPSQCPRGVITFGRGSFRNTTNGPQDTTEVSQESTDSYDVPMITQEDTIKEVTALHCWPYVEQVVLNITFSLPSRTVISANLQKPDPAIKGGYPFFSESEVVQNSQPVEGSTHSRPPWSRYLTTIRDATVPSPYLFDLFMDAAIWGKDGIPASELSGPENAQRLLARVEEIYGTIMAQLYNSNARIPIKADASPLIATVTSIGQARVVQSVISTRIMQAVLAAMFVCCAVTFILLDTNELLPQNPCSIGAAASLLAGSKLADRSVMPTGSEFLSDKEMISRGYFTGMKFRMGWWEQHGEKRFGIDVDHQVERQRLLGGETEYLPPKFPLSTVRTDDSASMSRSSRSWFSRG
jgi:hypothetical protein